MDTNHPVEKALFLGTEFSNQMNYHLERADGYNRCRDKPVLGQELRALAKEAEAFNLKVLAFGLKYVEAKHEYENPTETTVLEA